MSKLHVGINDLKTLSPVIAKEWHPSLNGELKPSDVHNGSSQYVWWLCPKGHSYRKAVSKRTIKGQGCPVCRLESRSFAKIHPELLLYWDYSKNKDINPNTVFFGSEQKIWWVCPSGHSYQQRISAKSLGAGCPICTHQIVTEETCLATINPEIAKEWHPTKNGELTPHDVMPYGRKRVWWLCPFGHEYQAVIYSRHKSGCPICDSEKRTSFPEQAIQFYLSKLFASESRKTVGGFEADIYCPDIRVAIEYDGEYFHKGKANDEREKRKNTFFSKEGLLLFRVKETKAEVPFSCNKTWYGYEINVKYTQDFTFIGTIISSILSIINERDGSHFTIDVNIVRDKVSIINQYAQSKENNSFLKQKPLGARKWDYSKNGNIDLSLLPKTSKKKYWWKCPTCGNEWFGPLDNVVNSLTCRKCSRQVKTEFDVAPEITMGSSVFRELPHNLQIENPDLASQWHPTKNGNFKPVNVTAKSGKRVWWLCPACGHEWTQIVKTRNKGETARKCPKCSKNQKKKSDNIEAFNPILYQEWDTEKNGDSKLDDYTPGSSIKVWWKCSKCGREYLYPIKNRKNGNGCAICGRANTNAAKYKKVRNIDTNEVFESIKAAANSCGVSHSMIWNCIRGKAKTAGGFRWEYYTGE